MGKKSQKVHLVFDADKRREFLTGFHKRKVQRQKQAKDEFEKALKEERKRIKTESKESYKKLVVSHRDIPELENLIEEQYEDDEATVKIISLSSDDLARQNNWLGQNHPKYMDDDDDEEEEVDENETEDDEVIPGMELKKKEEHKVVKKESFESEKILKKKLKELATKRVQKSKLFQRKNKQETLKQRKKSIKQKKLIEKTLRKTKKGRKRLKSSKFNTNER